MFMGGFMVAVAEYRQGRLGLGRGQRRFPRGFNWKRWREGKTGLRHGIEMFLFEGTGASLAMGTATAAMGIMGVGVALLLLVAAFTFDVSCPRLA
jgi:hypothetical protein